MYQPVEKPLRNATHYRIMQNDCLLSYTNVVESWKGSTEFRQFFIELLDRSPYAAFRWETPPITRSTIHREFEFVLIDTPGFATRRTDTRSFQEHFIHEGPGITTFANLGGDSTLIVPSPRTTSDCYGHLAAFIRSAPIDQVHELWRIVAETVETNLNDRPLWLSTAGGGVAWLHVRLDSRPKYYSHLPFKSH